MRRIYNLCRYFAGFAAIAYGFAKLFGAQFTVLDSVLDQPLRDVAGFWLTWYYFGYSPTYSAILALLQIGSGLMLTFRRTTLLGALILFGMMSNIVLIDIFYGVDRSGLISALVITACLLLILSCHIHELVHVFWQSQSRRSSAPPRRLRHAASTVLVRALLLSVPAAFAYYVANYNNRAPTPIDGTWRVVETLDTLEVELPTHVYFERNRAHMVVFRYPDRWSTHHFEVDDGTIAIWESWLTKGEELFTGDFRLVSDRLFLDGSFARSGDAIGLTLEKLAR